MKKRWTKEEVDYLYLSDIKNMDEIVKHLNRTKLSVEKKLIQLGIKNRNPQRKNVKSLLDSILDSDTDYGLVSYEQKNKIKVTHKVCGTEFATSIYSFINGHRCPNKSCILEAKKETCNLRYGKDYPYQVNEIKTTMIKSKSNKYFIEKISSLSCLPLFDIDLYDGSKKEYMWKCKACGNEFKDSLRNGTIPICRKCNPLSRSSKEKEVVEFMKEFCDISTNIKIGKKEIDIVASNVGIEFDGNYYHSELNGKLKKYHIDKTLSAKENGINLIHIFENEWEKKKDIVKSIIQSKLGKSYKIHGRKCEIRKIEDVSKFLIDNHIQGKVNSKVKLGLYFNNELVSVMTFGTPRYNKKYEWELIRFCNRLNTTVVGGASRLFKYFIKTYNPKSIISYADIRYSNGNMYEKIGFKYIGLSEPNYHYMHKSDYLTLISRLQFQKHKLKNKLSIFDENLTEWENMQINGYDRIWDCGNLIYGWNEK